MIVQHATIGGQSLMQRQRKTFVVLPVADARRNLPIALILHRDLARRRMHDGHGRRRRTRRQLLVAKARRIQWVDGHLVNLNQTTVRARRVSLTTTTAACCVSHRHWRLRVQIGVRRPNALHFVVHELVERSACRRNLFRFLVLRGTHQIRLVDLFGQQVSVFRMHNLFFAHVFTQNGIIFDFAFLVDTQWHYTQRGLRAGFASHVQWILFDVNLGECTAIAEIGWLTRHIALTMSIRRDLSIETSTLDN
mmetsp:Transcript_10875/g.16408  ORF Transcript_10875/g.16408 Transcript_10875/m.16408 type:complete len:250 (+) Transcript_10875:267-1016(+)